MTVSAHHASVVDDFVSDLAASVDDVRRSGESGRSGAYGTVE